MSSKISCLTRIITSQTCQQQIIFIKVYEIFSCPGQGLELYCNVDLGVNGADQHYMDNAMVHWTVNQRVLQSNDRLQISYNLQHADLLQGRIVIASTVASDSGNYSCLPSYATPDWTMIHIVTGKQLSQSKSKSKV